jgi:hypothetical protein
VYGNQANDFDDLKSPLKIKTAALEESSKFF